MLPELDITELKWFGLVSGMMERTELGSIVDRLMPEKRKDTIVSNGNCAKALVLNMLSSQRAPLSMVSSKFETMPTEHLIAPGIRPEHLNDDCLGRFLDNFHDAGGHKIANQFFLTGLLPALNSPEWKDNLELHGDLTSFHVHGAYAGSKPAQELDLMTPADSVIHITHGYSRDHHPELKQLTTRMIIEGHCRVPVHFKPLSGNAADGNELMEMAQTISSEIQTHAAGSCLFVADAALYSQKKLIELSESGSRFLTRMPATTKLHKEIIQKALSSDLMQLDSENSGYEQKITFPTKTGCPPITLRALAVRSGQREATEYKSLKKRILRDSEQEMKDFRKLLKESFACEEDCEAAIRNRVGKYRYLKFKTIFSGGEMVNSKGKPTKKEKDAEGFVHKVEWAGMYLEADTLLKEQKGSGWFILVSNDTRLSPAELLAAYKRQSHVERGFRFLKSPRFFTDSIFLKNPRRIESMLCLMGMALGIYAGLEHLIRKTLKENRSRVKGQNNKPTDNPTASWVFQLFQAPMLLNLPEAGLTKVHKMEPWQIDFLNLLGPEFKRFYPT